MGFHSLRTDDIIYIHFHFYSANVRRGQYMDGFDSNRTGNYMENETGPVAALMRMCIDFVTATINNHCTLTC